MSKTLYYTVTKELITGPDDNDPIEITTGYKTINVYEIVHGKPKLFCEIEESLNSHNSIWEIQIWLESNGYADDKFELKLL